MAWSGPLPPAEELAAYRDVDPELARVIARDFERRTDIEAEAARAELSLQEREMTLKEREQDLRIEESQSDIRTRDAVVSTGRLLVYALPVMAFLAMMFAPLDDAWRVAAAGVFLSPFLVIGIVLLLRGRMSDPERDVLRDTLPKIVEALARQPATRPTSQTPRDPVPLEGDNSDTAAS
jgi:hypothetical protein